MDVNVGQPGGARDDSYPRQQLHRDSMQQTPGSEGAGLFYTSQSGASPIPQQGENVAPESPDGVITMSAYDWIVMRARERTVYGTTAEQPDSTTWAVCV